VQGCGYGQKASTSDPSKARCPVFHFYYGHTTHHALPSIAVSDDIGAFVLGKACSYSSVLDTGGAQYHPVNDSSAACPLTSTCVPLQRLKNIPHSHAVGLHRQEQWHHWASILHLHGIVNGVVNSLTVFFCLFSYKKIANFGRCLGWNSVPIVVECLWLVSDITSISCITTLWLIIFSWHVPTRSQAVDVDSRPYCQKS